MADGPRPIRALPSSPTRDTGVTTSLIARIVIVATIVLGQLWALTVALEASLLDHDGQAWLLAGFSAVSFAVTLLLTTVDPPSQESGLRGRAATGSKPYVARPVEDREET